MGDSLARARADLTAGRPWKARDRLNGLLTHRQDTEVIDLLATVLHTMGDLPAAGALWFVTGRDDQAAREAVDAWHGRHGSDDELWRSIPAPIRREVDTPALRALAAVSALAPQNVKRWAASDAKQSWWEPIVFGGLAIGFVVGMWTTLRWIWD